MAIESDLSNLEDQLGLERRKVDVATHNFSVRELVRMMSEGELDVAPTYQRKFRWKEEGESLFVESVFLGLPIPPLFVATNVGFQWEVVDGLQRLSSLMHYMARSSEDLAIVNRPDNLRITGLEKLSSLNDVTFRDLPKNLQVYFGRQPLQVISLTDKSDLAVRFELFERLNRGSVSLTAQEVRACIYRGEFNDTLEELASRPNFLSLLKLQRARQNDGTKPEQVLKFFAYKNFRTEFDGKVEKFLNRYMEQVQYNFDRSSEIRSFENAVAALHQMCGGGPFLRGDHPLTPLVQFEACLVAIAELQSEGTPIVISGRDWLLDGDLVDASTGATNTRAMLRKRIDRAKALLSDSAL